LEEDESQTQSPLFAPKLRPKQRHPTPPFDPRFHECGRVYKEFEKLLIKYELQELEEQTIVRYLGGLDPKYAQVIELQSFSTFDEVCILAHKVETQMKSCPIKRDFSKPLPKGQPFNKGSLSYPPKPTNSPPSFPQKNQAP